MSNITGRFLFASLVAAMTLSSSTIFAHDSQQAAKVEAHDAACEAALTAALARFEEHTKGAPAVNTYIDQVVANDSPAFTDLIDPDPAKNLFARAPLAAMSGAQRILAMVLSQGVTEKRIAFLAQPVLNYPFLTAGTEVTQGYRVEGNWKQMEQLVSFMTAQAMGDRSGRTVPLLFGPGGTGKSEARTVIEKGAEVLTLNNPDFFVYSFDWIRMNELDEMRKRWGPDVDRIPAPRNTSPIAILPPAIQKQALEMAGIKGEAMLNGIVPKHTLRPDAWSRSILKIIIEHYTQKKGSPLTMAETLKHLSHHVRLRRFVMSAAYRQFPIVNVQGIEADHSQLFVSSNPIVQNISPEGKMDPFAYSYSGLIFQGDGNATFFEEMTRSAPNFLEKLMDGLESRVLQAGGATQEPWDSFVAGISNKESWETLMNKGGLKALRQRFQLIGMIQPSQPQLIARTILYGFKDNLFMQEIGATDGKWEKGDIDKIFPIAETLEPGQIKGPERRYRLRIGQGKLAVEVSPHTLRFMAQIIAATRFETDKDKAYTRVPTRLVHDHIFTDPIQRIRYWEGKLTDITPEERNTLDLMTEKLGEGHRGIVHRNALGWLRAALDRARKDKNLEMTLTPSVLLQVFEEDGFRTDGFIQSEDGEAPVQENEWKRLARLVLTEILIPTVTEDINFAHSAGKEDLAAIYPDVIRELFASKNPNATTYTSKRTGRSVGIDRKRVEFIRAHYKKNSGKDLPLDDILFFHMEQVQDDKRAVEPSPEIASALAAYAAIAVSEARKATGGSDINSELLQGLERLGYNRAGAHDALDLKKVGDQPSQTAEQPQ